MVFSLAFAAALYAHAQTDFSVSAFGEFTRTSEGNGVVQQPSVHLGGMGEVRHIWNPLMGLDVNYSYNRANQIYNFTSVKANANQVGASWVLSLRVLNLRPFALAGVGGIYFRPDGGQPDTADKIEFDWVYGGGFDWTLIPHIGLRLQYRGNLYRAPDMLKTVPSTGVYTHTAEPMAGAFIRF